MDKKQKLEDQLEEIETVEVNDGDDITASTAENNAEVINMNSSI